MTSITQLTAAEIQAMLPEFIELLRDAVDSGASIGFIPPLLESDAVAFWQKIAADVEAGTRVLLVALDDGKLVGTVQLGLETRLNSLHRAEVQKLIVHNSARKQGIGAQLMKAIEAEAHKHQRSLLVLDTIQGDSGDRLYRRLGFIEAGVIPNYARNGAGILEPTVLFYKILST